MHSLLALAQYFLSCSTLIISLIIVTSCALLSFSLLKSRTNRTNRSDLLTPKAHFHPDGKLGAIFPCLLSKQKIGLKGPQHTKPELYISVIVPAMNEEKRLPQMLDECLDFLNERAKNNPQFTYEVIVVDDGSTDSTAEVAYSYSRLYPLFVLQLKHNLGKGGAVREGVLCARGKFILFADADGATRFADLEKLEQRMQLMCNGESAPASEPADWTHPALVVGSRAHLEKESIARRSLVRTVLMVCFHMLVRIFTVRTVRDTQCGFKLLSRASAAKLFSQLHVEKWAFDVELLYLAEQLNYSIAEVAVEWTEIEGSKVTPFISWIQMGFDILLIWFRYTFGIWRIDQLDQC